MLNTNLILWLSTASASGPEPGEVPDGALEIRYLHHDPLLKTITDTIRF
jgi:hypothetical protein